MKIVHCQDLSKKEVKREKLVFRTLNRSNTSKKIKSIAIIDTFIPPNQWVFSPLQDCKNPTPPCRMLIPARLWYSYSCSCRLPPSCIKQRVIYILITKELATLFLMVQEAHGGLLPEIINPNLEAKRVFKHLFRSKISPFNISKCLVSSTIFLGQISCLPRSRIQKYG